MKAVICLAGEGKRLRPLTVNVPKGLIRLGGKSILEHMLDHLEAVGIKKVIIVVGYKAKLVQKKIGKMYRNCHITYVFNPDYAITDNLYSLWLARKHFTEDMIFFNGDIVFEERILRRVVGSSHKNNLAVDDTIPLMADSMKVHLEKGQLKEIGKKITSTPNGWAIGIYRLSATVAKDYFEKASSFFKEGPKSVSFVVPFQMIAQRGSIKAILTEGLPWMEIDTLKDYKKACQKIHEIIHKEKKMMVKLIEAGMTAVMPDKILHQKIHMEGDNLWVDGRIFSLKGKRIFVIGAGKAASTMAEAIEKIFGPGRITAGTVISSDAKPRLKKIDLLEGDHPMPSQKNIIFTEKILAMKKKYSMDENDLIIALISGGGSALMTCPAQGVLLKDLQALTQLLLSHGVDESELAVVRKKISRVKGGKLAEHFAPTPIIALILSDVSTNEVSAIASGPLERDQSTVEEAWNILEKYALIKKISPSILSLLEKNQKKTPTEPNFDHVTSIIVADNDTAKQGMMKKAKALGLRVKIESNLYGEAKNAAIAWCEKLRLERPKAPTLFVAGGFTSVNVGDAREGIGGRNQEFVLACLEYLRKNPLHQRWCIASIATDGVDFIKASAGGIIDLETLRKAKQKKMNLASYLTNHDSYHALLQLDAHWPTRGPSGTNVCDIVVALLS